ncbi:MAG: alpha/beta hydrolase [Chitinophagia bacterium]|nr:alpha/beta hydrolase [Chitinophagia bacterium]
MFPNKLCRRANALLIITLITTTSQLSAQTREEFDAKVRQFSSFYNANQYDSIAGMLSERSKTIIAPDKLKQGMVQLHAQAGALDSFTFISQNAGLARYRVKFRNIALGLNMSMNATGKLESFRFVPLEPAVNNAATDTLNANGETITLHASKGKLYGTLTVPEGKKPVPVVMIITGSGPTDRNGNNSLGLKTNTYRLLADTLKAAGIACLRYDKRGVGASAEAMGAESSMTFDDMENDAVAFFNQLRSDKRFNKFIIVGHSEGSLIGMLVAQKTKADKFISLAGAGSSADELLKVQMIDKPADVKKRVYSLLDSIKKGYIIDSIPAEMMSMFRPSIQPYLHSWFAHDPHLEIKKVKIPTLIVQGNRDIQVSLADAKKLKDAAPSATMVVFPGMDHILKQPSTEQGRWNETYFDPSFPLFPGMPLYLVNFILK